MGDLILLGLLVGINSFAQTTTNPPGSGTTTNPPASLQNSNLAPFMGTPKQSNPIEDQQKRADDIYNDLRMRSQGAQITPGLTNPTNRSSNSTTSDTVTPEATVPNTGSPNATTPNTTNPNSNSNSNSNSNVK